MAVDPNVLGLSIELQMNTLLAEKGLDKIVKRVGDIESDVSKSLNVALNGTTAIFNDIVSKAENIQKVFDAIAKSPALDTTLSSLSDKTKEIDASLDKMVEATDAFNNNMASASTSAGTIAGGFTKIEKALEPIAGVVDNTRNLNLAFVEFNKELKEAQRVSSEMNVDFTKYVDEFKEYWTKYFEPYKDAFEFIQRSDKLTAESFADMEGSLKKIKALTDEVQANSGTTAAATLSEAASLGDVLNMIQMIEGAVLEKNRAHQSENDLIGQEGREIQKVYAQQELLKKANQENIQPLDKIKMIWFQIARYAAMADDVAEKFHLTTYRGYGSMYQLGEVSQSVSFSTGIAADKCADMVKELMHVKTPIQDLQKLSIEMVKIERMTGLSGKSIANATRVYRNMGFSVNEVGKKLQSVANHMRTFGLETEEADMIIELMMDRQKKFGKTMKDTEDQTNRLIASQLAHAKSIGVSKEAVKGMNDMSIERIMLVGALAGMEIKSAEDMAQAHAKIGAQMHEQYMAAGDNIVQIGLLNAQYKGMGFTEDQIALMRDMGKRMKDLNLDPNTVEGMKEWEDQLKSAQEQTAKFNESMDTFSKKVSRIFEVLKSAFVIVILMPILDGISFFLSLIVWLIDGLAIAFNWLGEQWKATGEVGEYLRSGLYYLWYAISRVLAIVIVAIVVLALFSSTILGFLLGLIKFKAVQDFMAAGMLKMAKVFRLALKMIVNGINSLADISPKALLIIIVISLAVAAAVYILAQAFKVLADKQIMDNLGMLSIVIGGLMAALYAFVYGLISLGTAVTAGSEVLLPLIGVLLAVAVAVLILAVAVWIMADAFMRVSSVLTLQLVALVIGLSVALGFLAIAMYAIALAAIPFIAIIIPLVGALLGLAVGLLAIGIALIVVGLGAALLASSMSSELGSNLKSFGEGLASMMGAVGWTGIPKLATLGAALIVFAIAVLLISTAFAMASNLGTQFKEFADGLAGLSGVHPDTINMMENISGPLMKFSQGIKAVADALAGTDQGIGAKFKTMAEGIAAVIVAFGSIDKTALDLMSKAAEPLEILGGAIGALSETLAGVDAAFTAVFKKVATDIASGIAAFKGIDVSIASVITAVAEALSSFGSMVIDLQNNFSAIDLSFLKNLQAVVNGLAEISKSLLNAALPLLLGASVLSIGISALATVGESLSMTAGNLESAVMTLLSIADLFSELSTKGLLGQINLEYIENTRVIIEALSGLSSALLNAAMPLIVGAYSLSTGATALSAAGNVLMDAAIVLESSVSMFGQAAVVLADSAASILASGSMIISGAWMLKSGATFLVDAVPLLLNASMEVIKISAYLFISGKILEGFSKIIADSGTAILSGANTLLSAGGVLMEVSVSLAAAGPALSSALTSFMTVLPTLTSLGEQLMPSSATLYKGALLILMASYFLEMAIERISGFTATLSNLADPLERMALAFGSLANSMALIKDAITGLSAVPIAAVLESLNRFSPTEEALNKVEKLALALQKIGEANAKSVAGGATPTSELAVGKMTTVNSPIQEAENPNAETNQILESSKDTLESILEALKPQEKKGPANFGVSLFSSPRGFEI